MAVGNTDLCQYSTPAGVVHTLLRELERYVNLPVDSVFEPCAGDNSIARELVEPTADVPILAPHIWTNDVDEDLVDRYDHDLGRDFLEVNLDRHELAELGPGEHANPAFVVTNPPFTTAAGEEAADFVKKGIEMARHGAAFVLRSTFLEACKDRHDLLHEVPPTMIVHLYPRISFSEDGGTDSVHHIWGIWLRNREGTYPDTTYITEFADWK